MTRILDLIAEKREKFEPEDCQQYVALQLAKRLQSLDQVQKLVSVIAEHSVSDVANVFRRTQHLPLQQRLSTLMSAFPTDN